MQILISQQTQEGYNNMAKELHSFVYLHSIAGRGVFYVGKGTLRRSRETNPNRRNAHYNNITSKYGVGNMAIGTIECSDEKTAFLLEVGIIKCLKRQGVKLANKTNGGEGSSGCKKTDKEKKAISKRKLGSKHSKEAIDKMSKSRMGNKYALGSVRSHNASTRKQMSESGLKRFKEHPITQATKDRMSASKTGVKHTIVTCPHCGKSGGKPAMHQWHYNNCKLNKKD